MISLTSSGSAGYPKGQRSSQKKLSMARPKTSNTLGKKNKLLAVAGLLSGAMGGHTGPQRLLRGQSTEGRRLDDDATSNQLTTADHLAYTEYGLGTCLGQNATEYKSSEYANFCELALNALRNIPGNDTCAGYAVEVLNQLNGFGMPESPSFACQIRSNFAGVIQNISNTESQYLTNFGQDCTDVGKSNQPVQNLTIGQSVTCFNWEEKDYAIVHRDDMQGGYEFDGCDDGTGFFLIKLDGNTLNNATVVGQFYQTAGSDFLTLSGQSVNLPFQVKKETNQDGVQQLVFCNNEFGHNSNISKDQQSQCNLVQVTRTSTTGTTTLTVTTTTITSTSTTTTSTTTTTTPTSTSTTVSYTVTTNTSSTTMTTTTTTDSYGTNCSMHVAKNNSTGENLFEYYCKSLNPVGLNTDEIINECQNAADHFSNIEKEVSLEDFKDYINSNDKWKNLRYVINVQAGKLTCTQPGQPFQIDLKTTNWTNHNNTQRIDFLDKCSSVLEELGLNSEDITPDKIQNEMTDFFKQMSSYAAERGIGNVFKSFTPLEKAPLLDCNTTILNASNISPADGATPKNIFDYLGSILTLNFTKDYANRFLTTLGFNNEGNNYQINGIKVTIEENGIIVNGKLNKYDTIREFAQDLLKLSDNQTTGETNKVDNLQVNNASQCNNQSSIDQPLELDYDDVFKVSSEDIKNAVGMNLKGATVEGSYYEGGLLYLHIKESNSDLSSEQSNIKISLNEDTLLREGFSLEKVKHHWLIRGQQPAKFIVDVTDGRPSELIIAYRIRTSASGDSRRLTSANELTFTLPHEKQAMNDVPPIALAVVVGAICATFCGYFAYNRKETELTDTNQQLTELTNTNQKLEQTLTNTKQQLQKSLFYLIQKDNLVFPGSTGLIDTQGLIQQFKDVTDDENHRSEFFSALTQEYLKKTAPDKISLNIKDLKAKLLDIELFGDGPPTLTPKGDGPHNIEDFFDDTTGFFGRLVTNGLKNILQGSLTPQEKRNGLKDTFGQIFNYLSPKFDDKKREKISNDISSLKTKIDYVVEDNDLNDSNKVKKEILDPFKALFNNVLDKTVDSSVDWWTLIDKRFITKSEEKVNKFIVDLIKCIANHTIEEKK